MINRKYIIVFHTSFNSNPDTYPLGTNNPILFDLEIAKISKISKISEDPVASY